MRFELTVNEGLFTMEQQLTRLFTQEPDRSDAISSLAASIEIHGCAEYLALDGRKCGNRTRISVLALDVAWLVPGPDWIGSKGGQVCWSKQGRGDTQSWYHNVLDEYFNRPDAVSLLSIPDVFCRPMFVNFASLDRPSSRCNEGLSQCESRNEDEVETWNAPFDLRRSSECSPGPWTHYFERYCGVISDKLEEAHPEVDLESTMVAWVYVGPGRPGDDRRDSPPHWGASIFLVFVAERKEHNQDPTLDHVNTLLSNLLRGLQNSAPAALGNRREKQSVVQVVAHEFKNITQEASIRAQDIKSRAIGLSQSPLVDEGYLRVARDEIEVLTKRAAIMNYSVQLCSAFALATNWLFSTKPEESLMMGDPQNNHFIHALALTVRLVAAGLPRWTFDNVPTEHQILEHFSKQGIKSDKIENLTGNRSLSVMVFFALEAVRNMKANTPADCDVQVAIHSEDEIVFISLTAPGKMPPNGGTVSSQSLASLVEEVRLHCPWPLIEIDPLVQYELIDQDRVRRTTGFRVYNIPPFEA
jgi:hypothetical protein